MTINEQGFLSPDIHVWIAKHRAESREWFALAEDLNRLGQRRLTLLKVPGDDNQALLTALLFIRTLAGFQGAVVLAERGMTQEARTLTRGCFESVFCLGAALKDKNFSDALNRDDVRRRKTIAGVLLDDPRGLGDGHIGKLNRFLDELAESGLKGENLQIVRMAELAGLKGIYDVYYRGMSNDAAHPSVTSLKHYLNADANGLIKGLRWGPDVSDVAGTLCTACTAAIYVISMTNDLLNQRSISPELEHCWTEYKRLVDSESRKTEAG